MIDIKKPYKTAAGYPVKLFLIEGDFIHGVYKQIEEGRPAGSPTGWVPMLWVSETGIPYGAIAEDEYIKNFELVEAKETKQISHTVFVGANGYCSGTADDIKDGYVFASFTVNAELEEGSYKTFVLQDEPDNITKFSLTPSESRALQAIACYGIDAFLKVFYEKLGKHYLKPSETGIASLFSKIQKALPPLK